MEWDDNIYYNPEGCGLEILAQYEFSDMDYQFDTRIVLRDVKTLRLYMARDSGCSCPTPFEDFKCLGDLQDFSYDFLKNEQDYLDVDGNRAEYRRMFLNRCLELVRSNYGYHVV